MHTSARGPKADVFSAGVDYFTCTSNAPKLKRQLLKLGEKLYRSERDAGNKVLPYERNNFSGLAAGSVQIAGRDDTILLRMGGQVARENWSDAFDLATNVSRIDLNVIIRHKKPMTDYARRLYLDAIAWKELKHSRLDVSFTERYLTGQTCYCGRRISDKWFRGYDKFHESKLEEYRGCWTNEVEIKNDTARVTARAVYDSGDAETFARQYVSTYMTDHGMSQRWSESKALTVSVPRKASTAEKKLRWQAEQNRPVLVWLIKRGYERKSLEALGIIGDDGKSVLRDYVITRRRR